MSRCGARRTRERTRRRSRGPPTRTTAARRRRSPARRGSRQRRGAGYARPAETRPRQFRRAPAPTGPFQQHRNPGRDCREEKPTRSCRLLLWGRPLACRRFGRPAACPTKKPAVKRDQCHRDGARQRYVDARSAPDRDEVVRGRQTERRDQRAGRVTFVPEERVHEQDREERGRGRGDTRDPRRHVPAVEPPRRRDQPVETGRLLQVTLSVEERRQAPFAGVEHPLRVLRGAGLVTAHQITRAEPKEEEHTDKETRGQGDKESTQTRGAARNCDARRSEGIAHAASALFRGRLRLRLGCWNGE